MEYHVISTDSHVNEPPNCFVGRFPAHLKESAPKIVPTDDGGEGWTCEGRKAMGFGIGSLAGKRFEDYQLSGMKFSDLLPGNYDPVEHLKDQDRDGVDASIIYPGYGMTLPTIKDQALRLASFRAYNDWMAEDFAAANPGRIIGLAMLPVDDGVEGAVAELRRAVKKGHRGGILPTYPDRFYADPEYDPLWAAAQELGVPLHFHRAIGRNVPPGMGLSPHPGTFVASIVLRFFAPIEPISHILFAGVLQRFPGLKLVSAESDSGWLAFFMQACDDQWERQRHWAKLPLTRPPSEIIREQVFVTFMDDTVGCNNLAFTGADNLMWASDYPHSVTTWPNSRRYIEKQMKGVAPEARARLLAGNAVRLYGLG
jgi:predicted TIM-barrel fold metal-dependent hydrolase